MRGTERKEQQNIIIDWYCKRNELWIVFLFLSFVSFEFYSNVNVRHSFWGIPASGAALAETLFWKAHEANGLAMIDYFLFVFCLFQLSEMTFLSLYEFSLYAHSTAFTTFIFYKQMRQNYDKFYFDEQRIRFIISVSLLLLFHVAQNIDKQKNVKDDHLFSL